MTDYERYEAIEAELASLERAILARHRLIIDEIDRAVSAWDDPAYVTALDKAASYLCRAWDVLGVPVDERGDA